MNSYFLFLKKTSFFLVLIGHGLINVITAGNPKLTVTVDFHVSLNCSAEIPYGSFVSITRVDPPYTTYEALTDNYGIARIENVPAGNYNIQVHRFNYSTYSTQENLQNNMVLNICLSQIIKPPSGLEVNALSLLVTWNAPPVDTVLFSENWISGNFNTNQWTITGGNWNIGTHIGHSPPSALFNGSPQATNYHQYLTSRVIPAVYAANMKLVFETSLLASSPGEYLTVEISDGTSWQSLKEYSSINGSWDFTPEELDISGWSGKPFQVRFHAHGTNSANINYWAIDNIGVIAGGPISSPNPCVTSYSVFLNNTPIGTTTDTSFLISPVFVAYLVAYQVCVRAQFASGVSQNVCTSFTSQYLYPPRNFSVESVETVPLLEWEKPQLINGTTPPGLIGFLICRNGVHVKTFNSIDTLSWFDFDLDWVNGIYYTIKAIYDLIPYGLPGMTGYSLQAGPDSLDMLYWYPMPFYEGWAQGSFMFNDWLFQPSQGNWMVNASAGNPFPSACFTGSPAVTNYSYSLVSHPFDATPYTCADLVLDVVYKLLQVQPSSTDFLSVEINRGGDLWELVEEFVNSQNTGWVHKKILLPDAAGMVFKIRFRAHGDNSANIDSWCLDNISVYAVCRAPGLTGTSGNNEVTLTWTPPLCSGSGAASWLYYDDGGAETSYGGDAFQDRWFGNKYSLGGTGKIYISEIKAFFGHKPDHGTDLVAFDIFNEDHVLIATSRPFIPPDKGWINLAAELFIPPQNTIYVMVHYMGPVHTSNPVGYDTNGTVTSDELAWVYDGSSWTKITEAYSTHVGCFIIRLKATMETDDSDSSPYSSNSDVVSAIPSGTLQGYNIYRSQLTGSGPFEKLNPVLYQDTTYVDPIPPGTEGTYCYYVTSVIGTYGNLTCESPSDTVCFDIPLGLRRITGSDVHIYPNPATDKITIESDRNIQKISLIDCYGRVLIERNGIPGKRMHISFSDLSPGIYLLNMVRDGEVIARKIVKQ
jgi:hypothetical protein